MYGGKGLDSSSTEDEGSYDLPTRSWSMDQGDGNKSSRCSPCRIVKIVVIPVVALAILTALLVHFLTQEDILPFDLDLDLFRDEDPTDGEIHQWRHANGRGLELTLINALDPDWHPFFDTAVQQWDNGDPDSLTLSTIVNDPDMDCTPVSGYLKICNGDYGSTDWKGINRLYLQNGYIYQSVGKMNEYFLPHKAIDEQQYTMCHEIGHGFGLGHTDERFWNRNQGNCMDYTRRPASNKQPSETNFNVLAEVYGVIGSDSTPPSDQTFNNNQSNNRPRPVTEQKDEKDKDEEEEDEDDRDLLQSNSFKVPDWVIQANKDMDAMIDQGETTGWRKLHESEFGRAHEIDLGEGYSIQVHYLLA